MNGVKPLMGMELLRAYWANIWIMRARTAPGKVARLILEVSAGAIVLYGVWWLGYFG